MRGAQRIPYQIRGVLSDNRKLTMKQMQNNYQNPVIASKGIFLAILAAALYALNSPFSKLLLEYMPSTLMAGFLYLGAGVGMGAIALIRTHRGLS